MVHDRPRELRDFNPHLIHTSIAAIMGMAVFEHPIKTVEQLVEKEQVFDRACWVRRRGNSLTGTIGSSALMCRWKTRPRHLLRGLAGGMTTFPAMCTPHLAIFRRKTPVPTWTSRVTTM